MKPSDQRSESLSLRSLHTKLRLYLTTRPDLCLFPDADGRASRWVLSERIRCQLDSWLASQLARWMNRWVER